MHDCMNRHYKYHNIGIGSDVGILFNLGRPLASRLRFKAPSTYMYTYIQTNSEQIIN